MALINTHSDICIKKNYRYAFYGYGDLQTRPIWIIRIWLKSIIT